MEEFPNLLFQEEVTPNLQNTQKSELFLHLQNGEIVLFSSLVFVWCWGIVQLEVKHACLNIQIKTRKSGDRKNQGNRRYCMDLHISPWETMKSFLYIINGQRHSGLRENLKISHWQLNLWVALPYQINPWQSVLLSDEYFHYLFQKWRILVIKDICSQK